jgi:hypothetical protein
MRCLSIVTFPAPAGLTGAGRRAVLEPAVPRYQGVPSLRRKYFIGNAAEGGGVYEWDSRAAAEAFYDDQWFARMQQIYGTRPRVQYFDVYALVDNEAGSSFIDV